MAREAFTHNHKMKLIEIVDTLKISKKPKLLGMRRFCAEWVLRKLTKFFSYCLCIQRIRRYCPQRLFSTFESQKNGRWKEIAKTKTMKMFSKIYYMTINLSKFYLNIFCCYKTNWWRETHTKTLVFCKHIL